MVVVPFVACCVAAVAQRADTSELPRASVHAIVDVSVVPMTAETILERRTVIVRDGRIAAIGPVDEVDVPEEAAVIDGRHGFLVPGLVDAHTHLTAIDELRLCLANGVTTVCDLGGGPERLEWRDAIARG